MNEELKKALNIDDVEIVDIGTLIPQIAEKGIDNASGRDILLAALTMYFDQGMSMARSIYEEKDKSLTPSNFMQLAASVLGAKAGLLCAELQLDDKSFKIMQDQLVETIKLNLEENYSFNVDRRRAAMDAASREIKDILKGRKK